MKLIENTSEERYKRALAKVKKMKNFYIHLTIYLIFVVVFIWMNFGSGGFPWALFPIVGWGMGILGHASDTFDHKLFFGRAWQDRKIREIMDKEQEEQLRF